LPPVLITANIVLVRVFDPALRLLGRAGFLQFPASGTRRASAANAKRADEPPAREPAMYARPLAMSTQTRPLGLGSRCPSRPSRRLPRNACGSAPPMLSRPPFNQSLCTRRGGRAVECTALEMRHTGNRIGGSNPPLSATQQVLPVKCRRPARQRFCHLRKSSKRASRSVEDRVRPASARVERKSSKRERSAWSEAPRVVLSFASTSSATR
jgi:hypothetical protein